MNFEIPEELKMVQTLVRDFVRDQLKPLERDLMGRAAGLADARAYLPPEDEDRLQKLAEELGLWGPGVPEELGGMGLGALGQCLAEEEVAQTIVPFSFGDVTPLLFECSAGQRQTYFEPYFRRRRQAMMALLEPQDAAVPGAGTAGAFPALQTTAARDNGAYVISGTKMSFSRPGPDCFAIVFTAGASLPGEAFTTGATSPGHALATGRAASGEASATGATSPGKASATSRAGAGAPGPTCFLVDAGTPGFTVAGGAEAASTSAPGAASTLVSGAIGWRTQVRAPLSLTFDRCRVPEGNVLGTPGQAYRLGRQWLPTRRLVRGARCMGVGQRLLDEAKAHVESWQSFGQQIFRRPGVESALADIAVSLHACRLLVYEAACKADAAALAAASAGGAPAALPAGSIKREAAMVKIFATQTIRTVADRVSHLYNGPPYIQGLPMQRLCADALATNAVDLALELQSSIIASDIMKGLKV